MDDESLRLSVVDTLRSTLFVTLTTEIEQGDNAVHPYSAEVAVRWSPDDGPDVDLTELSLLSHVNASNYLPELDAALPPVMSIPIGEGSFFVADLSEPSCLNELLACGMDVALVGEALFGEQQDLEPLRSQYELPSTQVMIANSMVITPQWRGAKLGLLATDLVIERLKPGLSLAALYPMRPGLTDLDERMAANKALAAYWAQIGFVPFDGIMVRDLSG